MSDYLTAEQYEYARKTGDWESGKVLNHGQALNDNQKIVLEWLKEKTIEENHGFEFALWRALDAIGTDEPVEYELEVFRNMNSIQRKEVLAAFISWIQEQEE